MIQQLLVHNKKYGEHRKKQALVRVNKNKEN